MQKVTVRIFDGGIQKDDKIIPIAKVRAGIRRGNFSMGIRKDSILKVGFVMNAD